MTREQAIRKVLACLRLSTSSNPNEAAAALRHAQALIEKFGLTDVDTSGYDIREEDGKTGFRGGDLPQSLVALGALVANCYRCKAVVHQSIFIRGGRTVIRFYGAGADAQIAVYAFTVLRRQLQDAKRRHTCRIRKRANKDARGESFAIGWIVAVRSLLPNVELPEALESAIRQSVEARNGELGRTEGKQLAKSGRAFEGDFCNGYVAGKNAQLHSGVGGAVQKQLENS